MTLPCCEGCSYRQARVSRGQFGITDRCSHPENTSYRPQGQLDDKTLQVSCLFKGRAQAELTQRQKRIYRESRPVLT